MVGQVRVEDGMVRVRTAAAVADLHVVTGWALARGVDLPDLVVVRPTLEDVYLELTSEVSSESAT